MPKKKKVEAERSGSMKFFSLDNYLQDWIGQVADAEGKNKSQKLREIVLFYRESHDYRTVVEDAERAAAAAAKRVDEVRQWAIKEEFKAHQKAEIACDEYLRRCIATRVRPSEANVVKFLKSLRGPTGLNLEELQDIYNATRLKLSEGMATGYEA